MKIIHLLVYSFFLRSITIKPLGDGSKQAYDYIFPKEKYIASRRNDTFNDILNGENWRKYEYSIGLLMIYSIYVLLQFHPGGFIRY